jgi:GT2 family glycosyltransferase
MIKVICPYIYPEEIQELRRFLGWKIDVEFTEDTGRIGSDLMYEKMWNKFPQHDIFIMHADMLPANSSWLSDILEYVEQYPEAGIFGCKLLYPEYNNKIYIQSAGGKFENNAPAHFGSGLELFSGTEWKDLEEDNNQYDNVREVAWTTFGGCYIRRELLNQIGNFDPSYQWSYNRDVDYCLEARKAGWKIYQIPTEILHFESKDNKRLRVENPQYNMMEQRNLKRLQEKWMNTKYYKTINIKVDNE